MTHRTTSSSKAGRRLLSEYKRLIPAGASSALSQQQIDWNAEAERKRQEKKAGKNHG